MRHQLMKIRINFIDQDHTLLIRLLHLNLFSTKHCSTQPQEVPTTFTDFIHPSCVSLQIFLLLEPDYLHPIDKEQSCQFYHQD